MRCGVCGSERLSPPAQVRTAGGMWGVGPTLRYRRNRARFRSDFARACRDCGAVQFFLSESERKLLDGQADHLEDV